MTSQRSKRAADKRRHTSKLVFALAKAPPACTQITERLRAQSNSHNDRSGQHTENATGYAHQRTLHRRHSRRNRPQLSWLFCVQSVDLIAYAFMALQDTCGASLI